MRVTQRSRRWLVPVATVATIAGGAALGPSVADASPDLPDITAQQLLANVQTAKVDGLSGTVRVNADLGLPALPGIGGGGPGAAELTELLAGKHTIRVAYAAPDKARVSVLDDMAERVLVTDGTTGWQYDSSQRRASKFAVPAHRDRAERPFTAPDPQSAAKQFLDAIDPTTKVTVTGTKSVAGRDAYLLTLTPRTDRTTVGSVTLAVDAKQWVPLRATVLPRAGGDPAVDVGFDDVSFAVPSASTFSFTPPKGTKITEGKEQGGLRPDRGRPGIEPQPSEPKSSKPLPLRPEPDKGNAPTVIGKGWDAVVMARTGAPDQMVRQLLSKAPSVSGSWGTGKVLTSRMVSVLFTDDGRVFAGLVTPTVLEQAAAKAPR